jgi:hypothetical protein
MKLIEKLRLKFDYLCHYSQYASYNDYIHQKVDIYEMSTFSKLDSGLPVNLWLDTASNYLTSGYLRLKFQVNYNNKIENNNLGVMTISNYPEVIIGKKQKIEISGKDIHEIRIFITRYKNYLSYLADQKMSFGQFWEKYKFDKNF